MLKKKKMGIRRINLGKRYQAIEFYSAQQRQIYALYGIELVKSVLCGVQVRESSYSWGQDRIEYRVVFIQMF